MLKELTISNYKRMKNSGAKFIGLTRVNYLVGENGSGKTSVLNYLFDFKSDSQAFLVKDGLGSVELIDKVDFNFKSDTNKNHEKWEELFLDFYGERVLILDILAYIILTKKKDTDFFNQKLIKETELILKELSVDVNPNEYDKKIWEAEDVTSGARKIFNLTYAVLYLSHHFNNPTILIDEPSIHLHPSWQKKLPIVFEYLTQKYNVQFFVATHSPFIITTVGQLTDNDLTPSQIKKTGFVPNQKVYFLKNGRVASKRGKISTKGQNGYWGRKITQITSKMLGAGLMDLVSPQKAVFSQDSPVLILCEGEGDDEDAKIYNTIFQDKTPSVLFVSCRGSSQVYRTFQLLREIKPGLSANFEMLMVRDRDHEFPSQNDIKEYEKINKGTKILKKRAIECYIYNSETAKLLLRKFNKKLPLESKQKMDNLQRKIQKEVEQGVPTNAYKHQLEKTFQIITYGLAGQIKGITLMLAIARLITPKTKVYKELEKTIFE